ncbi:hypothetical protein HDU76_005473 [Blyttiomyces sp. JEL0837]|nr:hypothetical protein HDU76_005473 [Blyttiomyces sp. JEL0837]
MVRFTPRFPKSASTLAQKYSTRLQRIVDVLMDQVIVKLSTGHLEFSVGMEIPASEGSRFDLEIIADAIKLLLLSSVHGIKVLRCVVVSDGGGFLARWGLVNPTVVQIELKVALRLHGIDPQDISKTIKRRRTRLSFSSFAKKTRRIFTIFSRRKK